MSLKTQIRRKLNHTLEDLSKADKKKTTRLIFVMTLFSTGFFNVVHADTNILDQALAFFIRLFGDVLYTLFFSEQSGSTIEALVYNQGGSGITLTGAYGIPLMEFFMRFYLMFQDIAVIMAVPMGLVLAVLISRAGDSPQRKAQLKDMSMRMFMTVVWIVAMPQLFEWLLIFNDAIVSVFYSVVKEITGASSLANSPSMKTGMLMEFMKELAFKEQTSAHATIYLITIFLNIWMIFYYFIRDITISFLFMIFPLLAIFYPLHKDAVMNWWKEMLSNISTQTFHAMIMSSVVSMAILTAPAQGQTLPFRTAMYIITAFAMVIPFTGIVKSMLGMEGRLGGAKSMAGVGAMMGAMTLGRMGIAGLKNGLGAMGTGLKDGFGSLSDQRMLNKHGQIDAETGKKSVTGLDGQLITADSIRQKRMSAVKSFGKGSTTTFGGLTAGLGMMAGGLATGNLSTAMMLGAGGMAIGSRVGKLAGDTGNLGLSFAQAGIEQHSFNKLDQEAKDQITGLTSAELQGTDYKENEQQALMKKKFWETAGFQGVAQGRYSMLTNQHASLDDIKKTKDARMYVDKNQSVVYGTDSNGNKKILHVGAGDLNAEKPYERLISFNNGELELDTPLQESLKEQARSQTMADLQGDILSSSEAKVAEAKKAGELMFGQASEDRLMEQLANGGILDPTNKYHDPALIKKLDTGTDFRYKKLEGEQKEQLSKARKSTGLNNLTFANRSQEYKGSHMLLDMQSEVLAMANKSTDELVKVDNWQGETASQYELSNLNGVGYSQTSRDSTTYFQVEKTVGANGQEIVNRVAVGHGAGNPNLKPNQLETSAIKFEDGNILRDKIKYAIEGTGFNPIAPTQATVIDDASDRFGQNIISQIEPETQVMVTISVDQATQQGNYNVYDISNRNYIGSTPIPNDLLGSETHGNVYHIQVDSLGKMLQQDVHAMTDIDYHNAQDIQAYSMTQMYQREAVVKKKKVELNKIKAERENIRNMLSGVYNDSTVHTNYISGIQ
jgi:hypothetical protein